MKKLLFGLGLAMFSQVLFANGEVWKGSGTVYNQNGLELGNYLVAVENETINENTRESQIKVTLEDGRVIEDHCVHTYLGVSWKSECESSFGGGVCLGDGICQMFLGEDGLNGFASTIIFDSDSQFRQVRTELVNGVAIRFYKEKLFKLSN